LLFLDGLLGNETNIHMCITKKLNWLMARAQTTAATLVEFTGRPAPVSSCDAPRLLKSAAAG
jgi:hypothetical protein